MLTIHTNHQLKPLNTMGIDGTVTTLAEWSDAADLHQLFKNSEMGLENNPSFKAIGQGVISCSPITRWISSCCDVSTNLLK